MHSICLFVFCCLFEYVAQLIFGKILSRIGPKNILIILQRCSYLFPCAVILVNFRSLFSFFNLEIISVATQFKSSFTSLNDLRISKTWNLRFNNKVYKYLYVA